MERRSYAVVGVGALGGYYGAALHHAGLEVRFLFHRDFDHVRRHGLRVESVRGDLSIQKPAAYRDPGDVPACDVAMVCLKTTANHLLPDLLPGLVKPDGAVLMMQNGLGVEDAVADLLPGHPVLGGLAFLCSNKIGPGHIRHLDYGAVRLAERGEDGAKAGLTPWGRRIASDFQRADISATVEPDLQLARWKKLVWNVPYNGLCVVRDTTTDVLMADAVSRRRCEALMREVVNAADACGVVIPGEFVEKMLRDTEAMTAYQPSMLLDYRNGRPLELDAIYAKPLAAAKAAGAACPNIQALFRELQALDPGGSAKGAV